MYNRFAGMEFAKETGRKGSGDGVWRLADSARPPLARSTQSVVRQPTCHLIFHQERKREGESYIDSRLNVLLHPLGNCATLGRNPLIRIFHPPDAEEMRLRSDLGFRACRANAMA